MDDLPLLLVLWIFLLLRRIMRQHQWKLVHLVVYVDDIIITGDDAYGITNLKCYSQKHLQTKDLGSLRYLDIEVARSRRGITLYQRKYVLDMLSEVGILGCRAIDAPMEVIVKLLTNWGDRR